MYNMFATEVSHDYNNYRYSFETAIHRAIYAYLSGNADSTVEVYLKPYPIPAITTDYLVKCK
jgi:hypothetical protein